MYDNLITFIEEELKNKGWSHRELARRAGVSQTAVSSTLAGQRNPGADFCLKIAKAFNEPPEKILRLAGLLPSLPASEDDPILKEVQDSLKNMGSDERQEALNYIHYLFRLREEQSTVKRIGEIAKLSGIPSTTSQATYHLGTQFGPKIVELFSELNEERQTSVVEYIQWQIHLQKLEGSRKQEDVDESGIDSSESEEPL